MKKKVEDADEDVKENDRGGGEEEERKEEEGKSVYCLVMTKGSKQFSIKSWERKK